MRTEAGIRREVERLTAQLAAMGNGPKYAIASRTARIETLKWTLSEESIFDGSTD